MSRDTRTAWTIAIAGFFGALALGVGAAFVSSALVDSGDRNLYKHPRADGWPGRAETVRVSGGTCEISWWLSPLDDDVPNTAKRVAAEALVGARVSAAEWAEWQALLGGDPDNEGTPQTRLQGAAYLEGVRAHVRDALSDAGYPDSNRLIEVYSDLTCTT